MVLISSHSSLPTSCPHSCACVVLCFACLQEIQQGCLSWKSAPHPPHGPRLQPHLVLSHRVLNVNCYSNPCLLVQTILGCLHGYPAMVFGDIHIIPLSSGILHPAQPAVLLCPCDGCPLPSLPATALHMCCRYAVLVSLLFIHSCLRVQFGFSHLAFLLPLVTVHVAVSMLLLALSSSGYHFSPWVTSAWLQRSPTDYHLFDPPPVGLPLFVLPPYFPWVLAFLIAHSSSSHIKEHC